jgi:hypothetical protein
MEKFEDHGALAGFAVVVLTPDDVGGPTPTDLQPRARQNVIGEMFWFAGKLGRRNVYALKKGNLGTALRCGRTGYTEMDSAGAWKQKLLLELDEAGYQLDWKKALSRT